MIGPLLPGCLETVVEARRPREHGFGGIGDVVLRKVSTTVEVGPTVLRVHPNRSIQRGQRQGLDVFRVFDDFGFHVAKAALELAVGACEGIFRIDIEMPGEVHDREQQVPELGLDLSLVARTDGLFQLKKRSLVRRLFGT